MKRPLISIIVPVYNTSKYLRKCLDSLVGQSYTNIELILVDDGSTDNSLQICNAYSAVDSRIKIFHQSNQGSVAARQTGIDNCGGDYVMFVDSDDWVNIDVCSKLLGKAEDTNADLVVCDFFNCNKNVDKYTCCNPETSSLKQLHKVISWQYPPVLWNRLYKREVAIKSLTNCTIGDDIAEDFLISISCLLLSPSTAYVPEALYYHNRDVETSLVFNLSSLGKSLLAGINNIDKVYSLLKDTGLFEEYKYDFYRLVLNIKTYLLLEGRIKEAREIYFEAHQDVRVFYAISNPYRWFYYAALNWGWLGEQCFKIYTSIKSLIKRIKNFG